MRNALIVIGIVAVLLSLVRAWGISSVLFPTWALPKSPTRPDVSDGEVWTLQTEQGTVEAFFFSGGQRAPTVVFTHGNGEFIEQHVALARRYRTHGFTVLLPEYRGYGRSQGSPSPAALVQDFVAFFDRLRVHSDVDPARIYFHGRSLGGAVAAAASTQRPPRALVLEATFVSVRLLAKERLVPSMLVPDWFDTERALANVSFPVLVLHGRHDDIVPSAHATRLASVIPEHTLELLDCGHNDCPFPEAQILKFLNANP